MVKATALGFSDDNPAILRSLLNAARNSGKKGILSIGLSEADPLISALDGMKAKTFTGHHFLVGWDGEPPSWKEPFGFDAGRI